VPEQSVTCPRCGQMVAVPTTGEKVRCPGCGQKFRFGVAGAPEAATPSNFAAADQRPAEAPPAPSVPPMEPPLPVSKGVYCPDCGRGVEVPLTGEKVYCACGRGFRVEEPEEKPPSAVSTAVVPAPMPPPLPVLPSLLPGKEVRCPDCGEMVSVPTTGEKAYCVCGRKLRFATPDEAPSDAPVPVEVLDAPPAEGGPAPAAAPTKEVSCPECGARVLVPLTGEKVHCACGRKLRFAAPQDVPADAPVPVEVLDARAAEGGPAPPTVPTKEIACPDCGKSVHVPLTGEKVYCACGRKFRFEAPPAEVLAHDAPTPPPGAANEVKCPRCGGTVMVPVTGEKVRCPGCGQKFRFEAPPAPKAAEAPPPWAGPPCPARGGDAPPTAEAEVPGIASPSAVLTAAQAAPAVSSFAAAEELRALWPALVRTIHRAYEQGQADDENRVGFRAKADRAAELAGRFLGPPAAASSAGHVFATSVLPEMALDEIISLSLEDYRHLDETLDDVQHLLDARLPKAPPPAPEPAVPRPVAAVAEAPLPRRGRGLSTFEAVAAILSIAALAAVIVFFPEIQGLVAKWRGSDSQTIVPDESVEPETVPRPGPSPKPRVRPRPRPSAPPKVITDVPVVEPPEFQPVPPQTSTPVPPEKQKEEPEPPEKAPVEPKEKEAPPEPASPWARLGAGAHRLFNGTDLKDWAQAGAWELDRGMLRGRAAVGPVASAVAGNPEWRDYTVHARARIVRADRVTREGEYYLVILRHQDPQNFICVRFPIEGIYEVGYYRNGAFHEAGRARHGLGARFNQWHDVEVAVRGDQVSVVIDNVRTGAPPWSIRGVDRGAVGVGVTGGQAEFDNIRVRVER